MNKYPFPFFGSGDAEYFEWASLLVVFDSPPSEEALAGLLKSAPPPLLADDEPTLDGRVLNLSGGQMSHVWIADAYAPDDGEEPDFSGRFPFAAPSQVEKFNRDIERWLHEIADFGVTLALRAPDSEAGGTEYDAWHAESLEHVLEAIEAVDAADIDDEWLTLALTEFAQEAGHEFVEDTDTFEARVLTALNDGNGAALVEAIEAEDDLTSSYYQAVKLAWDPDNANHLAAALDLHGSVPWLDAPNLTHVVVQAALFSSNARASNKVLAQLAKRAQKKPYTAISMASMAQKLAETKQAEYAWLLLDRLVDIDDVHPIVLEIALYALGEWVTGVSPDPERVARYEALATPSTSEHPRLLLYLAVIAEESGDLELAESHVAAARTAGISDADIAAETPLVATLARL